MAISGRAKSPFQATYPDTLEALYGGLRADRAALKAIAEDYFFGKFDQTLTAPLLLGTNTFFTPTVDAPSGTAWEIVGVEVNAATASGTLSATIPAAAQEDDLLVAFISWRSDASGTTITAPSGWTIIDQVKNDDLTANSTASVGCALMAYIVHGASPPSVNFTRTVGGAGAIAILAVVAYRNVDVAAPFTGQFSIETLATNSTTATAPSITTPNANDLVVALMAGARSGTTSDFDATDPGTASGATDTTTHPQDGAWTERLDASTTAGADCSIAVADAIRTTAGATGAVTATTSASARHTMIMAAFRLTGGAPGAQDLQPALLVDQDVFFAPTVTTGAVALSPPLTRDADRFFAPTVTPGAVALSPPLTRDADRFFAPTIARGAVTLSPPLHRDQDRFFAVTVTTGAVGLSAPFLRDGERFYAHDLTQGGVALQPPLLRDGDRFLVPTITTGAVGLSAPFLRGASRFYAHTLSVGAVALLPPRLRDADRFFVPSITRGAVSLSPPHFRDGDRFFTPAIAVGAKILSPTLFRDGDRFFVPAVALGDVDLLAPFLSDGDVFFVAVVANAGDPGALDAGSDVGGQTVTDLFVPERTAEIYRVVARTR